MFTMANELEEISTIIHNHELEMLYWDKYILSLVDFMYYTQLKRHEIQNIHNEIVIVNEHKKDLSRSIEYYLQNENKSISNSNN